MASPRLKSALNLRSTRLCTLSHFNLPLLRLLFLYVVDCVSRTSPDASADVTLCDNRVDFNDAIRNTAQQFQTIAFNIDLAGELTGAPESTPTVGVVSDEFFTEVP